MLQAGQRLKHTRLTDKAPPSVTRLLSESGLKAAQKPRATKHTRTALKSILIFRDETILPKREKCARERDRHE